MPPVDVPFAAAAFREQQIVAGAATADAALAAAFLAAKYEAAAAQERVRAAALAWERECSAADALTRLVKRPLMREDLNVLQTSVPGG